jgi:hypothetical protein
MRDGAEVARWSHKPEVVAFDSHSCNQPVLVQWLERMSVEHDTVVRFHHSGPICSFICTYRRFAYKRIDIAGSSNGRTHDSDSCYRGSNPCLAARINKLMEP